MFRCILFCFLLCSTFLSAQNEKTLYVKGNALLLPVAVINVGFEYQLSDKYTLQMDGLISPWKSFNGNHAQIYMAHAEGRYYFNEVFRKWYVGINAGFGLFDLTKWNYIGTDKFQRGYNFMLGATVGYQWQLSEKWNLDAFLGGGTSQGFYHGYADVPARWIRYDDAEGWNRSGEFLPYRGGIMIAYKLN